MSLLHEGTVLVTGAAGFIGYHLCDRLLHEGCAVVGIDNLNDYYDPRLKEARLARLLGRPGFTFHKLDIADRRAMPELFVATKPRVVVHLAAQAGVRYSLSNPHAYVDSNLVGFVNVLEGCRHSRVRHLVYASSSSVYGLNTKLPFSVHDIADHPVSLYAATKRANELMAHAYSHLYGLPTTGLRFFTVYGPWGRPDMSLFVFTRRILAGQPIEIFNGGRMRRDFTYIDDIVEGLRRIVEMPAAPNPKWEGNAPDPGTSIAPCRIYNIGGGNPVDLLEVIEALEAALGKRAERVLLPMQPGDVPATHADVQDLEEVTAFRPKTSLREGIERLVHWYTAEWFPSGGGTRGDGETSA